MNESELRFFLAPLSLHLHDYPIFERQSYGIALKTNSPYRESINQALLEIVENGTYDEIYQKWFGKTE